MKKGISILLLSLLALTYCACTDERTDQETYLKTVRDVRKVCKSNFTLVDMSGSGKEMSIIYKCVRYLPETTQAEQFKEDLLRQFTELLGSEPQSLPTEWEGEYEYFWMNESTHVRICNEYKTKRMTTVVSVSNLTDLSSATPAAPF